MPRLMNTLAGVGLTLAAMGSATALAETNHKPITRVTPGQHAGELVVRYSDIARVPLEDGSGIDTLNGFAFIQPNEVDSSAYWWTKGDQGPGWDYWTTLKCIEGNKFQFKRGFSSTNPEAGDDNPEPLNVVGNSSSTCKDGKLRYGYIRNVVEHNFLKNPPKNIS